MSMGADKRVEEGRIIWEAFPSWYQFGWLFLISFLTGVRGGVLYRLGLPGWEDWIWGSLALIACAGLLRRWIYYVLTPRRLSIKNGYSDRVIAALDLDQIHRILILQGPIASFFEIGTLEVRGDHEDQILLMKGVRNPQVVKTRIQALQPVSSQR
ncbi:MAG: PH domain-containing protein [Nitrospirales bacterium]